MARAVLSARAMARATEPPLPSVHDTHAIHRLRDQQVTGRAARGRVALRAARLHGVVALAVILHDLCKQEARGVRARYPGAGICENAHARTIWEELTWGSRIRGPFARYSGAGGGLGGGGSGGDDERAVIKGAAGTWAAAPGRDIMGGLRVGTNFGCGGAEAFTIHTRPGLGFIRIGDSK